VYYRILDGPPGFIDFFGFTVVAYKTIDFGSSCGNMCRSDGSVHFNTIGEARLAIPSDAAQLPFEARHQFHELWESPTIDGLLCVINWHIARVSRRPEPQP
jgi:hypothetical protein